MVSVAGRRGPNSNARKIDGLKAAPQRRRVQAQCEIILRGVPKKWISNHGIRVMSARAPLIECRAGEFHLRDVGSDARVPVEVIVDHEAVVLPGAAEKIAGVEEHDVVREVKRDVFLLARAHELVLLVEGEDIVPDRKSTRLNSSHRT